MTNPARVAAMVLMKRRAERPDYFDPDLIFDPNFPQQRAFAKDPAKLKALFCTRRSAKSFTLGICAIYEALTNPHSNCLLIGLTRQSTKDIFWKDVIEVINDRFRLGGDPNLSELTWTFPNGSVLKLFGADDSEKEKKKLLGKKWRFVGIDEGSMYTIDVRDLIYGILKPAVTDPNAQGERGSIGIAGTASDFPQGLFYDITTGAETGWSVHTWTAHDNPYVAKQWQEELDEIAALRPAYMETPQFRQWYLNEWVIDEEKLVYKFAVPRNLAAELPKHLSPSGWVYMLGIDLGWEDDNAFVLTAYHEHEPILYVVSSWARPKMTFDAVVEKTHEYLAHPSMAPCKVVVDGANKQGVESMRARSPIPFEYADKQDKTTFIELCNGDLVQGKIRFLPDARCLTLEMMALVWKTDGGKIILPKKEHPSLPNHRCDAFLYNWRMGFHFMSAPSAPKVVVGSRQWYAQQAENVWEREREHLEAVESDRNLFGGG